MVLTDGDKKDIQKMIVIGVGEALEQMVLPRFDQIDARFDKLEKRIDGVEERLENKIDALERKLDAVTDHQAEKLDNHEKRLVKLENAVLA